MLAELDDAVISLYARCMSGREIQRHLKELYHAEVSPALISAVTDEAAEDVRQWQGRPLGAVYPTLYLDCIHVKVQDSGTVGTKAVYLALGVDMSEVKELLDMWIPHQGGNVLTFSGYGATQSRGAGHFRCLRRRPQGVSRGHRKHVPESADSTEYSAFWTALVLKILSLAVRYTFFKEDASPICKDNAPENMTAIRRIAFSLAKS